VLAGPALERVKAFLAQHLPDLILLDLNLPDMHGSEVLEQLRANPLLQETPVVVISADATPGQIQRLMAGGARAYLTKPLDIRQFLETLDAVLATGAGSPRAESASTKGTGGAVA
jgi:CheY-like chemotaxis protein